MARSRGQPRRSRSSGCSYLIVRLRYVPWLSAVTTTTDWSAARMPRRTALHVRHVRNADNHRPLRLLRDGCECARSASRVVNPLSREVARARPGEGGSLRFLFCRGRALAEVQPPRALEPAPDGAAQCALTALLGNVGESTTSSASRCQRISDAEIGARSPVGKVGATSASCCGPIGDLTHRIRRSRGAAAVRV
jgi:hypothetical protein